MKIYAAVFLCAAAGWAGACFAGTPVTVTGGSWAVQDTSVENPLGNKNAQLGVNLTLDKDSVNQLIEDVVGDIVGDALAGVASGLLSPVVDTLFTDILSTLGLGTIGIGGGDGGIGGAGGGGIALGAGSSGLLDAGGNFTGGTGTSLKTASLLPILDGVVDVTVGIAAGGGGGLTQGGGGYDLLGGDNDEDPDGLLSSGGGGGGLGITAGDLGYSASSTSVTGTAGTTFNVEDTGTLNIFGGSGGGGGLVSAEKILDLLEAAGINSVVPPIHINLLTILDAAIQQLLPGTGISLENLLVPEAGAETMVEAVNQTGGTVNVIGGFGGGGGLLLDSTGASGGGSTVGTATITGGTMNVYGGAGGGANITTTIAMDGGAAGGGKVNGGSISGAGSVLNIYSGADGGDVSSLLSVVAGALDPLSDDGNGGEGEGGYVGNFTVTNNATMNLYAGTSDESNVEAKYNGSGSRTGDLSSATAKNIVNTGGDINLYGGRLTGTYTQSGTGSVLNLAGGAYSVTGSGTKGGGLFTGGLVKASGGARELANAQFGGVVATTAAGSGVSLLISNADITAGGDLTLGANVTLSNAVLNDATSAVRVETSGHLGGTYTQNNGALYLSGGDTDDATAVAIKNGYIYSTVAGSELSGDTVSITGTVITDATGPGNSLRISGATVSGAGTDLTIGANVTLDSATLTQGQITLKTDGTLSGTYTQSGSGTLLLAGGGAAAGADIMLSGGTVKTDTAAGSLSGAKITGDVDLTAGAGTLTLSGSTVNGAGIDLGVGNNVVLNNTAVTSGSITVTGTGALSGNTSITTGTVTLSSGTLSGAYVQNGAGATLVLAGGSVGTTDFTFNAGALRSDVTDGALSGADFLGSVSVTASAGNKLTLTNAAIGGSAFLDIGANVTLNGASLTQGQLTLSTDGTLAGTYTQSGSGTLVLAGGSSAGADITLSGGEVKTGTTAGTLSGAKITGDVTLAAGTGILTLTGSTVNGASVNLGVGNNVVLNNTTVTTGAVTLSGTGALSGGYTQNGGALHLTGNLDLNAAGVTDSFAGGVINAAGSAVLTGADITGTGIVTATAGVGATLTLSGVTIAAGGNLHVGSATSMPGDGVVLNMPTHSAGTITLNTKGSLGGSNYTLNGAGATLVLDGGVIGAAAVEFANGAVRSDMSMVGGEIDGVSITGAVSTSASAGNSLIIGNAAFDDESAALDIGARVTLNGTTNLAQGRLTLSTDGTLSGTYTQSGGGTLVLAGGNSAGADITLSGGAVQTGTTAGTLNGAKITGDVDLTAGAGTLTLSGSTVNGAGIDLGIGANVILNNTAVTAGTVTLSGGALSGAYTQDGAGATLVLAGGSAGTADLVFNAGALRSDVTGGELIGADFLGAVTVTASAGKDLTLTGSAIGGSAVLDIGANVTLAGTTTIADGRIILTTGGAISGSYVQTASGELVLNGGTTTPGTTVTLTGGSVATMGGDRTLDSAIINGAAVIFDTTAGDLTLADATLRENGVLTLTADILLDEDYTQTGGTLNLTGSVNLDTAGVTDSFSGGVINADADATLTGANITGTGIVTAVADTGTTLTLAGVSIAAGANLHVGGNAGGGNAVLDMDAHAAGGITLNANGSIDAGFTQSGGGLTLAGGGLTGADSIFTGGSIASDMADGRIDGATFNGVVSTSASTGNKLTLENANIQGDAELDIGERVVLDGVTSLTDGQLTLSRYGTLDGTYSQDGDGVLVLAGGDTAGSDITLSGGTVKTETTPGELAGATIDGDVTLDAGAGKLTLTGSTVNGDGIDLAIDDNVVLRNTANAKGTITLNTADGIDGAYTQGADGKLVLAADGVVGAGAEDVVTLSGGGVLSNTASGELSVDSIDGDVDFSTDGAPHFLTITGSTVGNAADVTAGANVILKNTTLGDGSITLGTGSKITGYYTQNNANSTLYLAGGTVDGTAVVNVSAGTIQSNVAGATMENVHLEAGDITLTTDGNAASSLTMINATVTAGFDLTAVGANVFMIGAKVEGGTFTIKDGSSFSGEYAMHDGTLVLAGGNTDGMTGAVLDGGTVKVEAEDSLLKNASIGEDVDFIIDAGMDLTIDVATVIAGGDVSVVGDLTLKTTTLETGGKLSLDGGALSGAYTQEGGDLTLNAGDIGGLGNITLSGGTVTATDDFDLGGGSTRITGDVAFSGTGTGSIDISGAVIAGEDANARLKAGSILNNGRLSEGTITLDGGTMGGSYTQSGDGQLVLVSGSTAGVNGATFEGGGIESRMDATLAGVVIDGDIRTVATGTGSLTLSGTDIRDGSTLNIGDAVTLLGNTANDGATITLAGTGKIDGAYTQSGDGALNLAGGTIDGSATFSGGSVNADGAEAELAGAIFTGEVRAGATGDGALDITGSAISDSLANLILGAGATLSDSSLTGGKVTLEEGGALGAEFAQSGGTLAIDTDTGSSAAGAEFTGGTIASLTEGAELIDAEFTGGMMFAVTGAGSTLTLTDANIDIADASVGLNIGAGVILNDSTLTRGKLSLDADGALAGAYTQEADGTLVLNGGTTAGAETIFNGGFIEAEKEGSVLDSATFNAAVGIDATSADLEITRARITNGAILTLGDNVSLVNAELRSGAVTLEDGSALSGEYTQYDGGVLNLAGGTTGGATSTFAGGEIYALIGDAILNDVHITGEVDIDASAGALTITNAHVMEDGVLDLRDNVTLAGAELEQGEVILKENSALGGFYKQSGGTLTMAGGDINGVTGSEFSGGVIVAAAANSIIKLASVVAGETVFATVDDSADAAAALTFVGTEIAGGDLNLAAKTALEGGIVSGGGVTLEDGSALAGTYTQSAGGLLLSGGDASAATLKLSGGTVTADVAGTLGTVEITAGTGVSLAGASGATLTASAVSVIDGVLGVGAGSVLAGATAVADGGLILDGGSIAGGGYTQTGGTLLLRSDSFDAGTTAIHGGAIVAAAAGGATMRNVSFLGEGIALAVDGESELRLVNALIDGGAVEAYESIVMDVTIAEGGLRNLGSAVVLNGIAGGGRYTQEFGSLALADAVDTEGGAITLRSGSVIAAEGGEARLHGAGIPAGGTVAAGENGGRLHLAKIAVDGGHLSAGAAVGSLTDMSVTNSGLLSIGNDSVLAGGTTLGTLGGIRFADETAGNRATVENLRGGGGVFHFTIDTGAGVTDYYTVEASEGEHLFALTVTGGGAGGGAGTSIDLLTDVSDGATYALAGNGLEDAGALLTRYSLASREETDGSRIWSLDRAMIGLNSSAEGVGNAPAVTLAQVTTGMDELGRHFRNVRGVERERQSWAEAMANTEDCACVEFIKPEPLFTVWASSYTHHMAVDAFSEVSMNMHGLDIGFERRFDALAGGALYAGFVMGGQWLNNLNIEQSYGRDGSGSGKAMSLGAYGLWMNSRGWFADAAARFLWADMDLTSFGADGRAIKYAPGRRAAAASAEFGRRISFGSMEQWHVEPGVGLLGSWIEADSFMANGTRAEYGVTKSLQARAGVEFGYTGERLSPYAEVSFIQGFDGRTAVRMAGEKLENDPSGARVRASLGATVRLTENLSLSFDAAYERGASFRDINGNLGISYSW